MAATTATTAAGAHPDSAASKPFPNKQVDAVYYWGFVDSDGVPYTGANGTEYDIEFPFAPPVNNYSFGSIVANRHPNVLLGAPPPPGSPPGQPVSTARIL
ncbi:hypothetical protein HXX76_001708 [Chlamydomonas incerta]|uniref:Uncharacterized protein n=1 Tax=Chlamydomonas incerta TaxID=51695 RepID=A0A835TQ52_CHLIN|nr:hypothetical protein HXX76_001708 [Chlamydomonas incerta]|eukprot:KAG2443346.1 hypothetical protein HXX76_001708 [Chlamydomonas incerta]